MFDTAPPGYTAFLLNLGVSVSEHLAAAEKDEQHAGSHHAVVRYVKT